MLRVVVQRGTAAAVTGYYAAASGAATSGLVAAGIWGGAGALRLGLVGPVEPAAFAALCRNEWPAEAGRALTPRTNRSRRVGYDFNFNGPKSLSVLYGLTQEPDLLTAFRAAVVETLQEIEPRTATRVRRGGANALRPTGNLTWATFLHATARPVAGWPDPHLHAHAFAFNVTYDPVEDRWKAVDLAAALRDAPYFEAAFHARLAARLRATGLDIVPTEAGWEIAGVPERVVRAFSRRTHQVEARTQALGVTDPRAKDALGARTRRGKRVDLTAADLRARWWAVLGPDDRQALHAVASREVLCPVPRQDAARAALTHAIAQAFERDSVVPVRTLLAAALRRSVGQVTVAQLHEALPQAGLLLCARAGRACATTVELQREERRLLAFARAGRAACRPLRQGWSQPDRLPAEEATVVRHVLESADRVILVREPGGAALPPHLGNTSRIREAIETAGVLVVVLGSTADGGVGDPLTRLFRVEGTQEVARERILWLARAGHLGSRLAARLFAVAERLGARVVLAADPRRSGPSEPGTVFSLLQSEAGLAVGGETGWRLARLPALPPIALAAVALSPAHPGWLRHAPALPWQRPRREVPVVAETPR